MLNVNFSPFPVLETKRLLLRKLEQQDAEGIFALRSDKLVMQHVNRPLMHTLNDATEFITKIEGLIQSNDAINWGIALKEKPEWIIGNIGIFSLQKENYRAEIGYILHHNHWRKGYMQEALEANIEYGFKTMNLHSLEAHIGPKNVASAGILERNGFIKEAYFKENYVWEGEFMDTIVYSLLNK